MEKVTYFDVEYANSKNKSVIWFKFPLAKTVVTLFKIERNIAIANIPVKIATHQNTGIKTYFIHSLEGEYVSCELVFALIMASAKLS